MGVSKVNFGDSSVMDITDSTVNTNNLLDGEVAYGADGNRVVGSVVVTPIEDATVTFTEAQTRINIASGETVATLFGKIKKWLSGLQPVAFAAEDRYLKHSTGLNLSTHDAIDERVDFWIYDQYGVKNIIPPSYSSLPTTVNGVTITAEDDGSIRINGTRTNSDPITITLSENLPNQVKEGGDYDPLMTFSLKTNSSDVSLTAQLWYQSSLSSEKTITNNQTDHFALGASSAELTTITIKLNIGGSAGDTYNNKNAYFMLYAGNYSDGTWYPYAMTNRELTLKAMQPNGHTIKDDSGTSLAQKDDMQFGGVYSHNDGTTTKVDIVREFNSPSAVAALTGEAAKGFQHTPDTVYRGRTASDIGFDKTGTSFNSTRVQDVLEEADDRIDGLIQETSFQATTNANGVVSVYYYSVLANKVIISAICTSEQDSICVVGHYNYGCWIKVMDYNLEKIANTDVTIKMWYKDLDYNP